MAALNFPDPNVTTSYTNPDTGITYEWSNGIWKAVRTAQTAPELFVDADGDNLTGNLTLGTDKIVLNATDGSASFAGGITTVRASDGRIAIGDYNNEISSALYKGNLSLVQTTGTTDAISVFNEVNAMSPTAHIRADGSAEFAGTIESSNIFVNRNPLDTTPPDFGYALTLYGPGQDSSDFGSKLLALKKQAFTAGNQESTLFRMESGDGDQNVLTAGMFTNAGGQAGNFIDMKSGAAAGFELRYQNNPIITAGRDGSATFAGGNGITTNNSLGITSSGTIQIRQDASGVDSFQIRQGSAGTSVTTRLKSDGSATFAGQVSIDGSGSDNCLFISQNGTGKTRLRADGSAQFDNNVEINRNFTNETALEIKRNGTSVIDLRSNGSATFVSNVGVGASPVSNRKLTLDGGSSYVIQRLTAAATEFCKIEFGDSSSVAAGQLVYDNTNDSFSFTANNSEAMRIDSSGRLLVGMESTSRNEKLQVTGGIKLDSLSGDSVTFTADGNWHDIVPSFFGNAAFLLRGNASGPGRHCSAVALATQAFGNGDINMLVNSSHNNIAETRIEFRWNPSANAATQALQARTAGNVTANMNSGQPRVHIIALKG